MHAAAVQSFPWRRKINMKLTALIAVSASLLTINAIAGTPAVNEGALQLQNAVRVTGASNSGGGTNKDRETLSIATADASGPVADAKCTLTNAKGNWSLTAPADVDVRRSDSDLQIKCEKTGYDAAVATIKASTTQIPKPQFHFGTDAGGDGEDSDAMITVPQYASAITVTFGNKQTNAN
jgi:hypothetical protein